MPNITHLKWLAFSLLLASPLRGQFFSTPPTLDGDASESDYVTDVAWSMGWDDNYLYLRYSGGASDEPAIFYIDVDPIIPVSGGVNSNGSLIGQANWGITPTLPMRADFMIYWEANYAEYRTNDNGGWSSHSTINTNDRSNTGTASREIRLAWTWMGLSGRPSAFNWYGYANSRAVPGFIFNNSPSENPGGSLGNPRINFYWTVSNTNNGSETSPFSRKSVEHREGGDLYLTGANTFYDITNNANNLNDQIILENNSNNFTINLAGTAHLYGGIIVNSGETFDVNENATVRINANGYIENNSSTVSYNSTNSTLVYQNGGAYTVAAEWPAIGGATNISTGSSGTALTIPSDRQLNGNLTLVSGSSMSLNEGVELDVSGNLSNAGTITLNASSTGYAQLKVDGTISGTGTVTLEQYLEAGWHNISSLGSGNAGILGSIGSSNSNPNVQNLFTWDASNSSWNNIDDNSVVISGGDGFTAFVGDNGSFLGVGIADPGIASWTYVANNLVDGNFQPTLSYGTAGAGITYNSGNPQDGWNLIGNPFPCALNLTDALGWGSDVEQSVTIYNPSGSYNTKTNLSPDGVAIAPGQSFWIRTTASIGDFTFPIVNMQNNCDVGQSPTFHKTHNVIADRLFLNAFEAADHSISDNFLLGMVPGTTDDLDIAWDATKRLNVPTFPSLMSVAYGYPLAINAIDYSPNHLKTKKLQLRFVSGKQNEVYFIELHDSLLSNNYHIELEDLKLRRKHNLNNAPYKFVHDQNAEYRFVLHISPVTTINQGHTHTPVVSGGVNVGINGGMLVLKMDAPAQDVSGALLDLNGRRVMEVEYPAGVDQHLLDVSSLAKGIYLLQLQSTSGEEVHKIILP